MKQIHTELPGIITQILILYLSSNVLKLGKAKQGWSQGPTSELTEKTGVGGDREKGGREELYIFGYLRPAHEQNIFLQLHLIILLFTFPNETKPHQTNNCEGLLFSKCLIIDRQA